MKIVDSPTEQTTAATDVLLAAQALACAVRLQRMRSRNPWKINLWSLAFGMVASGAALGAVSHGFQITEATRQRLWKPLNLVLSTTIALFVSGTVYDTWGQPAARRSLPPALATALAFWLSIRVEQQKFWPFLLYQAVGMLFALLAYSRLALHGQPGARLMVAGILLSMLAAVVQTRPEYRLHLLWEFDRNGLYHLVQLAGMVAIEAGLRESLTAQ